MSFCLGLVIGCCVHDEESKANRIAVRYIPDLNSTQEPTSKHNNVNWIKVPEGVYQVGTDEIVFLQDVEGPAVRKHVSEFYMMKYEVSNKLFAEFISETNYTTNAEDMAWSYVFEDQLTKAANESSTECAEHTPWWIRAANTTWKSPYGFDSTYMESHPVVHVSWNDAIKFCKWLNATLPSEDQWEAAAHGTSNTNHTFPWGNDLRNHSNTHLMNTWQGKFPFKNIMSDAYEFTAPIDSFNPQNSLGFYHLVGNVWEWTLTKWTPRDHASKKYIKKGGSFLCHKRSCYRYRIAARSFNEDVDSASNIGFRCVRG